MPEPVAVPPVEAAMGDGRMRLAPERFYAAAASAYNQGANLYLDSADDNLRQAVNAVLDLVDAAPVPSSSQTPAARTDSDVIAEIAIRYLEAEPGEDATDVYGELVHAVMVVKHRTDPDWAPREEAS